jgi:cytochrome oxidase Cu insertion factor (SCO1/SenC/PrrC family)/thiol-disulfide isomerase/thioredoxin
VKIATQIRLRSLTALLAVVLCACAGTLALTSVTSRALADGDPGSDVLVNQNLFFGYDAGVTIPEQLQLQNLLGAASKARFPVRVAIIAYPDDLGSITPLWLHPAQYATFLGIELSDAYTHLLLVVMPNGFGINWPGHNTAAAYRLLSGVAIKPGAAGLTDATLTAVQRLGAGDGVKLALPAGVQRAAGGPDSSATSPASGAATGQSAPAAGPSAATSGSISGAPNGANNGATSSAGSASTVVIIVALVVLALVLLTAWQLLRWQQRTEQRSLSWAFPALAGLAAVLLAGVVAVSLTSSSSSSASANQELGSNPRLDPGTALPGTPAPEFTLYSQYGEPVSLRSYRGKVVLLAFNDAECTTICPLTTTAMLDAKRMLGAAAPNVQLLGVDADPKATSIEDLASYTQLHGLEGKWVYLTGSLAQLRHVWKDYGIEADITRGLISHTPALYLIDAQGRLRRVYLTYQSYAAVGQFGQALAHDAAQLLADHPRVDSDLSYAELKGISPSVRVSVPRAGGGSVALGPSTAPRLYLFFATWDREVTGLSGELDTLNRYQSAAASGALPSLTAIDEGSVEPSPSALPAFLHRLLRPLAYPVGVDASGRVADGYGVTGQPYFVLTSASGQIVWYSPIYAPSWPSLKGLESAVRDALAKAPKAPSSVLATQRLLAGSPPALAVLHGQASRLLGWAPALEARVRTLRGYPIVVDAWASWCTSCQAEFGLLRSASARYGSRVAFLGVDYADQAGQARAFMATHWLSYPSYQAEPGGLSAFLPGGLESLPTTFIISRGGKVVNVYDGEYDSQGSLDAAIQQYALSG